MFHRNQLQRAVFNKQILLGCRPAPAVVSVPQPYPVYTPVPSYAPAYRTTPGLNCSTINYGTTGSINCY